MYRNLTLGFFGFFLLAHLGFFYFFRVATLIIGIIGEINNGKIL